MAIATQAVESGMKQLTMPQRGFGRAKATGGGDQESTTINLRELQRSVVSMRNNSLTRKSVASTTNAPPVRQPKPKKASGKTDPTNLLEMLKFTDIDDCLYNVENQPYPQCLKEVRQLSTLLMNSIKVTAEDARTLKSTPASKLSFDWKVPTIRLNDMNENA